MKAVILAGGKGERLRPMTCACPKPLVNFMNSTVLDGVLEMLARNNIGSAVVTSMFMPEMMESFARSSKKMPLQSVREDNPLGTAGAVRNCRKYVDGTFLVVSGDCVTDIDLKKAIEFHKNRGAEATMVLIRQSQPLDFGVVCTDENGRITAFAEKPSWSEVNSPYCNAGIYILEPSVLELIPDGKSVDFSLDVFPRMLNEGKKLFGYNAEGYWCDIGDDQKYRAAHFDCLNGKCTLFEASVGNNVKIGENVKIEQPVYIGDNTVIEGQSVIGSHTVIGRDCHIVNSAISGSVIWDRVEALGAAVQDSVVCSGAVLKDSCSIGAGCVIGERCSIGRFSSVESGCKLWMDTVVEDETHVHSDRRSPAIVRRPDAAAFRSLSITELSPERVLLLARAFALDKKRVIISQDAAGISAAMASLVACGVSLSGAESIRCESGGMGQARFAVRSCEADGGIYVSAERGSIAVMLLDARGCDLSRRETGKVTRIMVSSYLPMKAGEIYTRNIKQQYFDYLISMSGSRPQGKQIALCGNESAVEYAAEALRRTGWNPVKVGNRSITEVIRENSCVFGASITSSFLVSGLYDQTGRRVSYEQFINLRAKLCFAFGADEVFIPCDCSKECKDMLSRIGKVERSRDNSASAVASDSWGESQARRNSSAIILDADVFMLFLCRYLALKHKFLSECVEKLPQSYASVARCPNQEKGRVMDELRTRHHIKARVIPDDSLAVLRIYASALSQEYARELAMDTQAIIDDTVRHGES